MFRFSSSTLQGHGTWMRCPLPFALRCPLCVARLRGVSSFPGPLTPLRVRGGTVAEVTEGRGSIQGLAPLEAARAYLRGIGGSRARTRDLYEPCVLEGSGCGLEPGGGVRGGRSYQRQQDHRDHQRQPIAIAPGSSLVA